ncbi:MAG: cell division protein, partial [Corynebacterium sp.]|nr:cell division protein [Corynebacterium sp.]
MNQETRKGGLGRGLAALIPSGPTPSSPKLGDGAADVILGGTKGAREQKRQVKGAPKPGLPGTGPT